MAAETGGWRRTASRSVPPTERNLVCTQSWPLRGGTSALGRGTASSVSLHAELVCQRLHVKAI
eukprot:scaffold111995_cov112-Phaeocystis_antarctica.AAC.1